MKTLHLLRHAKAASDQPGVDDHDRPLASRGLQDAPGIGRHLKSRGVRLDLALCSTARRAIETLDLVLTEIDAPAAVEHEQALYLCGERRLLERLRALPDHIGSVLLVSHNPDMHHLALRLAGSGDPARLQTLRGKFPTGACAALEFPVNHWRDIDRGGGRLVDFTVPKKLP